MSSKACDKCGRLIVFGKEKITGKIIPLSVGNNVYRVIKGSEIELDPKALVRHVCISSPTPAEPSPARDFNEPEEPEINLPAQEAKTEE